MKITDSENIKTGENDFIDNLLGELDWSVIERLLKEKYNLKLHDDIEYKNGDIVVHGKKVAYKLDFDVRVTLSLLFGRDGECLDISTSGEPENEGDDAGDIPMEEDLTMGSDTISAEDIEAVSPRRQNNKADIMANQIADLINEINE